MKSKPQKATGKLRIIGGEWRRRLLPVLDLPGLRPTTDRVRETLFNWLQQDIPGARCLDLFAGSGALGFEAASRGAASVTLLELQSGAYQMLLDNINTLAAAAAGSAAADALNVQQQDALEWLLNAAAQPYDVVFVDPPFAAKLLARSCELLEQRGWLAPEACIYLEMDSKQALPALPDCWKIVKQKKAGQVSYCLARRMA